MRTSLLTPSLLLCLFFTSLTWGQVTTPKSHFGFTPGDDYKLANYDQIRSYFHKLEADSDRIKLTDLGTTSEGRPTLMAYISSPQNLAKLDEYRQIQKKLALAEVDEAEADRLASQGKAIVWIDCSMHSNEVTPSQHAPLLAYRLLHEDSPEIRKILDNVILLLVPVTNPDGLQMITDWYGRNVGTEYELAPLPGLYQKYVGHDNNRDWYMLNLPETRNVSRVLYQEWFPHIVYNQHQVAPFPARIFVPPYSDPLNPSIPAAVSEGISLIGQAIKERLALEGKSGAVSYMSFDGWWNGGLRSTPAFHNMHGILTETAGFYYATPYTYDTAKFPKTFPTGVPTDKPSIFYADPWKGGRWGLDDAVAYNVSASMAILNLAASMPQHWSRKAWTLAHAQIEAGKRGSPYAYVIPPTQWDASSAQEMLRRLQANGVQVQRATADFSADGKNYPVGSYVISAAQPFRGYLVDLLEPHKYPELRLHGGPVITPYDSSGYTLSLQMGVDVVRVNDRFQAALADAGTLSVPSPVLDRKQNASFWQIADSLKGGKAVELTTAGDFVNDGAKAAYRLRAPRLGVYESYRPDMDGGWTQWLLDYYRVPFKPLRNETVRAGKLKSSFDSIIVASQPMNSILHGFQKEVPNVNAPDFYDSSVAPKSFMRPEYTGGIGMEGAMALKRFVEEGGTLIVFGEASELPMTLFPLPVTNAAARGGVRAPGTILRLDVAESPLNAGMPTRVNAFVSGAYAFDSSLSDQRKGAAVAVKSLANYAKSDLLASGWLAGESTLKGKSAVTEVQFGKGRVVLFGIRPQFRGQTFGTFKMLLNAIYLASADTVGR